MIGLAEAKIQELEKKGLLPKEKHHDQSHERRTG
jgi:hypothetical protein